MLHRSKFAAYPRLLTRELRLVIQELMLQPAQQFLLLRSQNDLQLRESHLVVLPSTPAPLNVSPVMFSKIVAAREGLSTLWQFADVVAGLAMYRLDVPAKMLWSHETSTTVALI